MRSQELREKLANKIWVVHESDPQKRILDGVIGVFDDYINEIIDRHTDKDLGTTDYDGLAQEIIERHWIADVLA